MCTGCWEEYGSPKIISPATVMACGLVNRVYHYDGVGGNLHVQLDDWNIEDEHWEEFTIYHPDGSSQNQFDAERKCFDTFKALTLEERASALALYDGYFEIALPDSTGTDGEKAQGSSE